MNKFADAFQKAIDTHNKDLSLENALGAETDLFHIIASAIEWCDSQNPVVDFDLILEQVRDFVLDNPPECVLNAMDSDDSELPDAVAAAWNA